MKTARGLAGNKHGERLAELSALHAEASELTGKLAELELVDGRRERELGLIEFELAEIEERYGVRIEVMSSGEIEGARMAVDASGPS